MKWGCPVPRRKFRVTESREVEVWASSPAEAVQRADDHFNPTAEILAKGRLKEPEVVAVYATDQF